MKHAVPRKRQTGATMIEILVTIVITAVGLLGASALQTRLQLTEVESYQRSQALLLLNDMAQRISANRNNAASYVTGTSTPLGTGITCPAAGTLQQDDANEWCLALQGASETVSGSNVGAMVGGRGCVEDLGNNVYMITVAWQGMTPISAPAASVACGANAYNDATTSCTNDVCRRVVTTIVRVATL